MKCHYEILGVSRDAGDSDIKTAYRKLALRWHPDKNLNNPEEAKEQFQLVQQAYEVLSDPHERAWYDNHREQILRGRNSNYEDSCLDVFQYFTVSCFKGYGDDSGGFYNVYSDVFEKIAAEDAEFMNEEDFEKIPKFGNSQSNYEDIVGPFYAYWQSYCTKKSYAWLCPYNINEIKDRRILREIEKEMKKIVQKAKRERNEEVRNLVSFVRKRDKRVQAYKKYLEEKAAINRQKQEQNRLEQIKKRKQEIEESKKISQNSNLNSDYEEQLKLLEQEYGGDSDEDEEEYESEYNEFDVNNDYSDVEDNNSLAESIDDLELEDDILSYANENYCIACNKEFKNEKAFQNHEASKKHRENIEKLRKKVLLEEELYKEENQQQQKPQSTEKSNDLKDSEDDNENGDDDDSLHEIENERIKNKTKNKKSKKSRRIQNTVKDSEDDEDEINSINATNIMKLSDSEDDNWDNNNKKINKKSKGKKMTNQQKINQIESNNHSETTEPITKNSENKPTTSKKSGIKDTTKPNINLDVNHVCVTCKSSFESKNKLFQHLKKANHGVYIPKATTNEPITATNKKGKKHK